AVLFYVFVAIAEIAFVGSVVIVFTTWPLWRRYRKLKREHDAKAREILERWRPRSRPSPKLKMRSDMDVGLRARTGHEQYLRRVDGARRRCERAICGRRPFGRRTRHAVT